MVWLKREQQAEAGHASLVGLMDALTQLQQGDVISTLQSSTHSVLHML